MDTRKAIALLQTFVKRMAKSRVKDGPAYSRWAKKNEKFMERCFRYRRTGKEMPSITALVRPFFHPILPLIGLNYTPVAHNTLHRFQDGWTPPLRQCRGVVFDRQGALVAKPFPKFFNYGEHQETRELPSGPFTVTEKHDGHLVNVFEYDGQWLLATRMSFTGPTGLLGTNMLQGYLERKRWDERLQQGLTHCFELIHPRTKVHRVYRRKGFILIGAFDRTTLRDLAYDELRELAKRLDTPVTERWSIGSIEEIKSKVADKSVRNREGCVASFPSGLRVKFKFKSYIGLMVEAKLSYKYLMQRRISGNLDKMLDTLDAEVHAEALAMIENLDRVLGIEGDEKTKREHLYALAPADKANPHYRKICRDYLRHLEKSGRPAKVIRL